MSSESNDKLWDLTIDVLKQLVREEEATNDNSDDEYLQSAKIYVRYMLVLADFSKVYDTCVQAQKRLDVKMTMESVICRVVQLHTSLLKSQSLLDLGPALAELKISPSQLEALTPLMLKEDSESVSSRITKVGATISSSTLQQQEMDSDTESATTLPADHTEEEPKDNLDADNKENVMNIGDDKHAATMIAALYRGSVARKQVSSERSKLDNLIGMSNSSKEGDIRELDVDIANICQQRSQEQRHCQQSYETALNDLKHSVLTEEGFAMQMELRDERIRWITEQAVTKHELPDSLEGFYSTETETVLDDVTVKKELKPLKECIATYEQRWKGRVVGSERIKSQAVDSEMAKDLIIRNQVRADLTPCVDEKLLSNLRKIKETNEEKKSKKKDKGTKGKGKKGGKKKGAGKKEKPLPGTKLPGIKEMQVVEMLECLVQNGLIYKYDEGLKLSDFIGPFEATDKTSATNPPPNAWELRMAALHSCILPMGSEKIRTSIQDESIRSMLFYGLKGSGKTLMMEIIASEIGALVIQLSSTSIGNAFENGIDATKLIHMIFTVAKEESLSPVIIYLDDCHEFFLGKSTKKGGSSDAIDMKRFQKDLLIYKNQYLTKKDRVLIIGCTSMPETSDAKLIKWKGSSGKPEKQGFFEHALYFPTTSQSGIGGSMLWKEAIRRKGIGPCELDVNLLAHMSGGYSAGKIFGFVNEILSDDRMKNLSSRPLTEHDFAAKLRPVEKSDQNCVDFRRQWQGAPKKKSS